MTYSVYTLAGAQPIASNETTQKHKIGTIVRAISPTYGDGEFIYLKGVENTVVGSMVIYKSDTGVTALSPDTAKSGAPVAVAMSACVASEFGWYQFGGSAVIKKTAVNVDPAVALRVFQSATTGRVMQTSATSKQILGATFSTTVTVTSTTSTAVVTLNRPHVQGNIT